MDHCQRHLVRASLSMTSRNIWDWLITLNMAVSDKTYPGHMIVQMRHQTLQNNDVN